jgi:hypothetical protein
MYEDREGVVWISTSLEGSIIGTEKMISGITKM